MTILTISPSQKWNFKKSDMKFVHCANTTYAQHGLVNIAKKKREIKSSQN